MWVAKTRAELLEEFRDGFVGAARNLDSFSAHVMGFK
jgi:hypothetical protein